jgi:hypothetical protein
MSGGDLVPKRLSATGIPRMMFISNAWGSGVSQGFTEYELAKSLVLPYFLTGGGRSARSCQPRTAATAITQRSNQPALTLNACSTQPLRSHCNRSEHQSSKCAQLMLRARAARGAGTLFDGHGLKALRRQHYLRCLFAD